MSFYKYTKMSTLSAMAVSLRYLYKRPLLYLGCGNYGEDFIGSCTVLLILEFRGFRLISRSGLSNSNCRYSLMTID